MHGINRVSATNRLEDTAMWRCPFPGKCESRTPDLGKIKEFYACYHEDIRVRAVFDDSEAMGVSWRADRLPGSVSAGRYLGHMKAKDTKGRLRRWFGRLFKRTAVGNCDPHGRIPARVLQKAGVDVHPRIATEFRGFPGFPLVGMMPGGCRVG